MVEINNIIPWLLRQYKSFIFVLAGSLLSLLNAVEYDLPKFNAVSQELSSILTTSEILKPLEHHKVRPATATDDASDLININFEKTDFTNLLQWIESVFKIKFLSGDNFNPNIQGKLGGNLISYRTHAPMTKQQVWDLFLTLIDMLGLTVVPSGYSQDYPTVFTIMPSDAANQVPLPAYVGVDWRSLPTNDTKIRYIYFVVNSPVTAIANLIQDFKSKSAVVTNFPSLNALIIVDRASNVRSLMAIVNELDSASTPESMSVIKLRYANAEDVVQLYQNLVTTEQKGTLANRLFGQKKQPTAIYFPDDLQLFAEPRSNSLIALGTRDGIKKVEEFILTYVDKELDQPYSPLYVYELQYANATDMAAILTSVTNFARTTPAATYGGVREGNKFLRPMSFVPETTGNRLLIKAEKDDYLKVREIIRQLDIKQPQIAIEVLIVNVTANKIKQLGTQLRSKNNSTLGQNVAFQTSGLIGGTNEGIIVNDVDGSLFGNLVKLAQGQLAGTTLVSIGSEVVGGVWALFQALNNILYTNVVSHPFLTTTNKYTAQVALGETRRIRSGVVQGSGQATDTFNDLSANLSVAITPQINSDGFINMNITIDIENFTDADPTTATKETKKVVTNANLGDGEILALGGLLRTRADEISSRVPWLGDIPVIGWFFKNKRKQKIQDNLLIFISPKVVTPRPEGGMGPYTAHKAAQSHNTLCAMRPCAELRDPLHRWFFNDTPCDDERLLDDYLENHNFCNNIVDPCSRLPDTCPDAGKIKPCDIIEETCCPPPFSDLEIQEVPSSCVSYSKPVVPPAIALNEPPTFTRHRIRIKQRRRKNALSAPLLETEEVQV
jgi:general secretion pathway protein D